ncbi:putative methyltransferase [Toxoplasma gondii FOU]|uniref:Putative methyltransferase n=2 Tax=Toxoplasma gondii TaxID=5811 RepID=A0A086LIF8_TOXGO|nr:putative methyltransferase [Toxoplasma gondii FOU]PUA86704.1 putative methyltransferase [Toxoplasma gondii TgCATBr9]
MTSRSGNPQQAFSVSSSAGAPFDVNQRSSAGGNMSKGLGIWGLKTSKFYPYEMYVPTRRRVHVKENQWSNPATQVWPQNLFLCKYLEMRAAREGLEVFQDAKVLELGSGCGLVGMVASLLGASVTVSELDKGLPLLRHNIEAFKAEWRNQAQISCDDAAAVASRLSLDSSSRDRCPFRMVICSDVWADKELRSCFLLLLLKAIATDSEVLMCHTWRNADGTNVGDASSDQEQNELIARLSEIFDMEEIETEDTIRTYCSRFHGGSLFLRSQSTIDIQETSDADGRIVILRLTCRPAIKDNPARLEEELKKEIALHYQRASINTQQHPVQPCTSQAVMSDDVDATASKKPVEARNSDRNAGVECTKTSVPEPPMHKRLLSSNSNGDHETSPPRYLRPRLSTTTSEPSVSTQDSSLTRALPATSAASEGEVPREDAPLLTKRLGLRTSAQKPGMQTTPQFAPAKEAAKRPLTSLAVSVNRPDRGIEQPPTKGGVVSRRKMGAEHGESSCQQHPSDSLRSKRNTSRPVPAGSARPSLSGVAAQRHREGLGPPGTMGRPRSTVGRSTSVDGTSVKAVASQVGDKSGSFALNGLPVEDNDAATGCQSMNGGTQPTIGRLHAASGGGSSPNGSRQKQPKGLSRPQLVPGLSSSTGTTRSSSIADAAPLQRQLGSVRGQKDAAVAPIAASVHPRPPSCTSQTSRVERTPRQKPLERVASSRPMGSPSAGTGQVSLAVPASRKDDSLLPSNSADPLCAPESSEKKPGLIGKLSSLLRRSPGRGAASDFPSGTGSVSEQGGRTSHKNFRKRSISRSGCRLRKLSSGGTTPLTK